MKSTYARRLSAKFGWAQLDVTRRSIEETAAAIMKLFADRQRQRLSGMTDNGDLARTKPLILASQSRARQMLLRQCRHLHSRRSRPISTSAPCSKIPA